MAAKGQFKRVRTSFNDLNNRCSLVGYHRKTLLVRCSYVLNSVRNSIGALEFVTCKLFRRFVNYVFCISFSTIETSVDRGTLPFRDNCRTDKEYVQWTTGKGGQTQRLPAF